MKTAMTIKIDAPRAYTDTVAGKLCPWAKQPNDRYTLRYNEPDVPVRIVRERDWRRVMAVVKAADQAQSKSIGTLDALVALRKHLERRR